jgi:hypothetical protein
MDLSKPVSRRNILKKSAAGLAIGAAVAVPGIVLLQSDDEAPTSQASDMPAGDLQSPLVAYVHDAANGEVVVMVGENQTIIQDPRLVSRLVAAVEV